jgi:hypothetical protein
VHIWRKGYNGSCFGRLPLLRELRRQLQKKIGDIFENISLMLGGKQKFVLNAVLDFAEASGRFRRRALVRARTEDASQSGQNRP